MKHWVLQAAILIGAPFAQAENISPVNSGWLLVAPAERATAPTVQKDADAEALFWQCVLHHYVRLKVFTKQGAEKVAAIEIQRTIGRVYPP